MAWVRRLPFMLTFLLVMLVSNWLAGIFAGTLRPHVLTAWGISHQSILSGEVFRLVTGTFLSHDFGMFVRQFCFAAAVIGTYEWLEGTWRAVAVFFAVDIVGSILVLFAVLPLLVGLAYAVGEAELLTYDVGMSAGGFGLVGAILAKQDRRWALLALATIGIMGKMWVEFEVIADTAHILCLFLGFGLQIFLKTWRVGRRSTRPTR